VIYGCNGHCSANSAGYLESGNRSRSGKQYRLLPGPSLLSRIWWIYPSLLFLLPNHWRFSGIPLAPETVLASFFAFELLLANSISHRDVVAAVPKTGWALLVVLFSIGAARGDTLDVQLRCIIWGMNLWLGVQMSTGWRERRAVIATWTAAAVIASASFLSMPSLWGEEQIHLLSWEHRTGLGYFLVPVLFPLAQWAHKAKSIVHSASAASGVLLMATVLVLTSARGAWVACLVSGLLLVWHRRGAFVAVLSGTVPIFGLLALSYATDTPLAARARSIIDWSIPSSSMYRWDLLQASFSSMSDGYYLGVPHSESGYRLSLYTSEQYASLERDEFVSDSDLIWAIVEYGPAAAVALALVWMAHIRGIAAATRGSGIAATFTLSAGTTFLAMSALDNLLSASFGWFIWGFVVGCARSIEHSVFRR